MPLAGSPQAMDAIGRRGARTAGQQPPSFEIASGSRRTARPMRWSAVKKRRANIDQERRSGRAVDR